MSIQPTTLIVRTQTQPTARKAERTGTVLNEEEEQTMRGMLHDEREHLSRVNQEIQRLESALAGLYAERKACIVRLDGYSLSLSPQKRLPPEILTRIFLEVRGGQPAVLPPNPGKYPWVLQSVCSQWRKVVQEESRLWSDLNVEDPPPGQAARVAIAWIPRLWSPDHSFPLSLSLGESSARNGTAIRKVLAPYFRRMQSLSLYVPNAFCVPIFVRHSCSFDALESLVLHICTLDWNRSGVFHGNGQPPTIFTTSTKLRTATFIASPSKTFHDPIYFPSFFWNLPWSQITHLTFHMLRMTSAELGSALRKCRALVSLSFTTRYNHTNNRDPNTPEISLPHLQSITVVFDKGESYCELFSLLKVPLLKEVTFDNLVETDFDFHLDHIELIGMLERSGAKLESLTLLGMIHEWAPKELLRGLPDLIRLVMVKSRHIPDAIFDMMVQREILQSLKHLECLTPSPTSFLGLLEHQCMSLVSGERHGITTAKVSYDTYATDEKLDTIHKLYESLRPKLESCGKDVTLKGISLASPTYWE